MELEKEIKQSKFRNEQHKLMLNIIYTANWFLSRHGKELKKYELTPEQFNVLRILRGQHPRPATVNLIVERMLNKMSNVSRLVEKLREKGLIERRICEDDRRACDVLITAKGMELLSDLDKFEKEWLDSIDNIAVIEAKKINKLLDRLRG